MNAPRLSLVMGGSTTPSEGGEIALPVPESGTVHFHLHLVGIAASATEAVKRPLGGWGAFIVGVSLVAAFAGGYQFGHRPPPDEVSNLPPMPTLSGLVPPEPAIPSIPTLGLPAIQRQLATPPQIIPPPRAAQQPLVATPAPVTVGPLPGRNAFGLEN